MNESLQALLARLKSSRMTSRTTLVALVCVLSVVAVVALVMAFRTSAGGQEFVGYWQVDDPVTGGISTIHIYRTADGFALQVSDPSVAPVPYLFKHGELVPAPGYENCSVISLAGKQLVMTPPSTSGATPRPKATLAPVPTSTPTTPQPEATGQQDPNAQQNDKIIEGVHVLQVAVQSWAVDHQDLYPTVDEVVSTGEFATYVQSWPTNPLTGQPMAPGTGPGDYTYEQTGQSFELTGYGVDGSPVITAP